MTTLRFSLRLFALCALVTAACMPARAQYVYDFSDSFPGTTINTANYYVNGSGLYANNGLFDNYVYGGALIWKGSVPTGADYEVKATLHLDQSSTGAFIIYLRATNDALQMGGNPGTYYSIDFNPSFTNGVCTAGLSFWKSIAGSISMNASGASPCQNGSTFRAVIRGTTIMVWIDNQLRMLIGDSSISSGQPGIGGASTQSNYISNLSIGRLDTVSPNAVSLQSVGTSSFSTRVDMHWQGVTDNTNGIGLAYYDIYRKLPSDPGWTWLTHTLTPQFADSTVTYDQQYSYLIVPVDYHFNSVATTVNVRTPPQNEIDPRQVGVRPLGAYWGGGGEQIDMRSGNLNFSIPLLKPQSRGGWGVSFKLSYNSQNWRQDGGGTWQLGQDVGYGYGWRFQAGSLTPVYAGYWSLAYYLFIDSTGAEYRLDQNNNGVWSSKEGIYVYYDTNVSPARLYFTDGSFWVFNCMSAGNEQDAGTMYPTLMQDTNGNQVLLSYAAGLGISGSNSSSRIYSIEDVRGKGGASYVFTYTNEAFPHLSYITNYVGTAESYSFSYSSGTLCSPFNCAGNGYGSWKFMQQIQASTINANTNFTYNPLSGGDSGELTQVVAPYGGTLRWNHVSFTFAGSRTQREVQDRFLSQSNGAAFTAHGLYRDSGDSAHSVHLYANLFDFSGGSNKVWWFQMNPSTFATLPTKYEERNYPSGLVLSRQEFTWATQATSQNPYIGNTVTTLDPGQSYQQQKKTTQTIDQYGNLTQMQVSPFNNLAAVLRTYTNQYLGGSSYTSRYIFNRVSTSQVTDGGTTAYLATNTYDTGLLTNVTGMMEHDAAYDTNFAYRGNVSTSTTPAGAKTFTYDIGGNVTAATVNGLTTSVATASSTNYAAPSQITVNSLSETMNWSAALAPTQTTGPNGDTASIGYGSGRPTSSTSPNGASTMYQYKDSYTPTPPTRTAITNGHWVRTTMDGFGRTIKTETGSGDPNGTATSAVSIEYAPCGCSPLGKLKRQSQPYAGSGSPQCWTTYTYDGSGRTLTVVAADGASTTTYVYQGITVNVTDPASKWKQFRMDPFGNLTVVIEPNPPAGAAAPAATMTPGQAQAAVNGSGVNLYFVTYYTYDILNHLTGVSMPRPGVTNPQTRTFNYTSGSTVGALLLSAINPENGTVSYTYNSDMTLHTKTDAKGQVFTYQYDTYKRLTQISVGGNTIRTFSYDTNPYDGSFSQYSVGRLTAIQNASFAPGSPSPISVQFTEMFSYTAPGQRAKRRLQVSELLPWNYISVTRSLNFDAAYTYDNEGTLTSVNYPTTWSYTGSSWISTAGPTYTYGFDAMHRPNLLTDQNNYQAVSNVQYAGPANELTSMNYFGVTESRQYNNMSQMTRLTVAGQVDISYTFPSAGSNAGKIASQTDNLSGEVITYAYDSLSQLASATSTASWNQSFGYDGFGSLVSKTGNNSPPLSIAVNAATNQVVGQTYDANGNQLTATGVSGLMAYDAENRLTGANGVQYGYDSRNKRVWRGTFDAYGNLTAQELYFYGVDGQKLGTYSLNINTLNQVAGPQLEDSNTDLAVFFRGKRVGLNGSAFVPDRLGSKGKYFPYGEDRGTPLPNDQVKFATYTRDSATGLDYANQRYYASNFARFMSPDRYRASARSDNPSSWNRYLYALADPINRRDPSGLCTAMLAGVTMAPNDASPLDQLQIALGGVLGFPYSGMNLTSSVGSVISQGAIGPNDSTQVALDSLLDALNNNTGSIDVIAYSGGAGAFTAAFGQLSPAQQARIGNILYISPGANGTLAMTADPRHTSVVLGTGMWDDLATVGTIIPLGVGIARTNCTHTDLACLLGAAQSQIATFTSNGQCAKQDVFALPPPPPRPSPCGGGICVPIWTPGYTGLGWGSYTGWYFRGSGEEDELEEYVDSEIHYDLLLGLNRTAPERSNSEVPSLFRRGE